MMETLHPCAKCKTVPVRGRCCMACNDRIGRLRDREAKGIITPEEAEELKPFPRMSSRGNDPGCSPDMASKIVALLAEGGRCGHRGGVDGYRALEATGMKFSAFGQEKVAPDYTSQRNGRDTRVSDGTFSRRTLDERTTKSAGEHLKKRMQRPDGVFQWEDA